MNSSSSLSKANAMGTKSFSVGQRCSCIFWGGARMEVYDGTIVELGGVAWARFQIDGDRIVRVFQSQLKAF